MTSRRERLLIALGVALMLMLGSLVLAAVRQAESNGRAALERLQRAHVEQVARGLDARVEQALSGMSGFLSAGGDWHITVNDAADAKRMSDLQALNPKSRTGFLLVDERGLVLNGTLLRGKVIGQRWDRPGIDRALAGQSTLLPVAQGVTTSQPTLALTYPIENAAGKRGVFVVESEVSATSSFSEELQGFEVGSTGRLSFVDDRGSVITSTNAATIANAYDKQIPTAAVSHVGDQVVVVASVPAAGWKAVFTQDTSEFEGGLTAPLRSVLVLVLLGVVVAAVVIVLGLARRLARSRDDQRRLRELHETREEFMSIVSSELRTPVVGLVGFLRTALDGWDDMHDADRRRTVSRAWGNARRLQALTSDVVSAATLDGEAATEANDPVNLRQLVTDAVLAAQESWPGRAIALHVPDGSVRVRGDSDRLHQLVMTLLDNAVLASARETVVDVALSMTENNAKLTVTDHGPPLSGDSLARVFDKFVRTRGRAGADSGLGLYLARSIAVAHHGELVVTSVEGVGTTFECLLPMEVAAPVSAR